MQTVFSPNGFRLALKYAGEKNKPEIVASILEADLSNIYFRKGRCYVILRSVWTHPDCLQLLIQDGRFPLNAIVDATKNHGIEQFMGHKVLETLLDRLPLKSLLEIREKASPELDKKIVGAMSANLVKNQPLLTQGFFKGGVDKDISGNIMKAFLRLKKEESQDQEEDKTPKP